MKATCSPRTPSSGEDLGKLRDTYVIIITENDATLHRTAHNRAKTARAGAFAQYRLDGAGLK